jgi:hypothetical protein
MIHKLELDFRKEFDEFDRITNVALRIDHIRS